MRVSFDVDDTLVCSEHVPTEQFLSWWRRRWYPEKLRRGTGSLMAELQARECEIWVYTTSYGSPGTCGAGSEALEFPWRESSTRSFMSGSWDDRVRPSIRRHSESIYTSMIQKGWRSRAYDTGSPLF